MSTTKHTSYRLSDDAKRKLAELAKLDNLTNTEVLNNLIQAEHRYRRNDIHYMKILSEQAENESKNAK